MDQVARAVLPLGRMNGTPRAIEPANDLRSLLREEHHRLEGAFEALAEAFRADPRSLGAAAWASFESALRAHLELEEQTVLPSFAWVDPVETAAILDEHTAIRCGLDELCFGVARHRVPIELVEALIAKLRAHAAREDALLYRWLEVGLPSDERTDVVGRLRDTARRFFAATS